MSILATLLYSGAWDCIQDLMDAKKACVLSVAKSLAFRNTVAQIWYRVNSVFNPGWS